MIYLSDLNKKHIGIFMTILLLPKALHALGVAGLLLALAVMFMIKKVLWILKDDKELEEKFGIRKTKSHTDTKSIS